MIRITLLSYVRGDGGRMPLRIVEPGETASGDDRVEEGVFLTNDEFTRFEARVDAARASGRKEGFEAARSVDGLGDPAWDDFKQWRQCVERRK